MLAFDVINQLPAFLRCFSTHLFDSHSGKSVQPGCKQPFPNWTAFHVEAPRHVCMYALPEFSLARHSVVTEGPRYVVYLRWQHRYTAVAVTVSYAAGKEKRNPSELLSRREGCSGEFRDDCFPLSLMSVGEYIAARVLRAFDPPAGCISTRADSQIIYRSLYGKPANHFHNKPPIILVLS